MEAVVSYILKSIIASGILYGYYLAALRNKKFHSYNRFYLLAAVVLSLSVPLMNFSWYTIRQPQSAPLNNILIVIGSRATNDKPFHFTAGTGLFAGALLVSIVLLCILLLKICWIYAIKRKHENKRMEGFTLIETPVRQAPFSFLDNLFWKKGMSLDEAGAEKIFSHELTHIRQKHTYDKLFAQLAVCLCWMNPFYWFVQKELNMIHEFIADEGCINEGDTEAFAMMLLQSHNEGRYLNPAHSFFHSPIKRRLIMITTSKKTPYSYARRVLALPLAAMLLAALSFTVGHSQATGEPKIVEKTFTDSMGKPEKLVIYVTQKDGKTNKPVTVAYTITDSASLRTMVKNLDAEKIIKIKVTTPDIHYKNPNEIKTNSPLVEKADINNVDVQQSQNIQKLVDEKKAKDTEKTKMNASVLVNGKDLELNITTSDFEQGSSANNNMMSFNVLNFMYAYTKNGGKRDTLNFNSKPAPNTQLK